MPLLDIFWAMLWFFLWAAWIVLLFRVFADIFRSHMSGWKKAGWSLFALILPLLGVLVYLIVHGDDMAGREVNRAIAGQAAGEAYIREVAGTGGVGSEVAKLVELRDAGVLSEAEFQQAKTRVLAG